MKQPIYTQQSAETLALQAIAFLAGDDDRLQRFIATCGLSPQDLTQAVGDSAALGGILDYILGDESLVIEFADHAGVPPEAPAAARRALPGGDSCY